MTLEVSWYVVRRESNDHNETSTLVGRGVLSFDVVVERREKRDGIKYLPFSLVCGSVSFFETLTPATASPAGPIRYAGEYNLPSPFFIRSIYVKEVPYFLQAVARKRFHDGRRNG